MSISKLTIPLYVDNVSTIHAADLNAIISKVNDLVDAANNSLSGGGSSSGGTAPSAPTITISGTSATISAEDGAIIKYTIDGSTPSANVGNTYSGAITLVASCTIKAVAIKNGLASTVAGKIYTHQSSEPAPDFPIEINPTQGDTGLKQVSGKFATSSEHVFYYTEIEVGAKYKVTPVITASYSYVTVTPSIPTNNTPYPIAIAGGKGTVGYYAQVSSDGVLTLETTNDDPNTKTVQLDLTESEHLYLSFVTKAESFVSIKFERVE